MKVELWCFVYLNVKLGECITDHQGRPLFPHGLLVGGRVGVERVYDGCRVGESGGRVGGEWGESGGRVGGEWGESGGRVGGEWGESGG